MFNKVTIPFKTFDLQNFLYDELPFTASFYSDDQQFNKEFNEHFAHYLGKEFLEVYQIKESFDLHIRKVAEQHTRGLTYAMLHLFKNQTFDYIWEGFKPLGISENKFKIFYNYVNHLIHSSPYAYASHNHIEHLLEKSFYGRFDMAVNPTSGKVTGVYEYNSDTPTMLFESMNLQNAITEHYTGDGYAQFNELWERGCSFGNMGGKNVAVVVSLDAMEDITTGEAAAQLLEQSGANVYFADIKSLNHDVLHLDQPFVVDGVEQHMDAVFILLPWEEMMQSSDILTYWEKWTNSVTFLEPAWRWFTSNKAISVYATTLLESGDTAIKDYLSEGFLKTYSTPDMFIENNIEYVSKPIIGRFSQNVSIHLPGKTGEKILDSTSTPYDEERLIYQEFCEPGNICGSHFLVCPWTIAGKYAGVGIREFDQLINRNSNERFVPHIVELEPIPL